MCSVAQITFSGKVRFITLPSTARIVPTTHGDLSCSQHSRGAAGRNRPLNIDSLMKEYIPVPDMPHPRAGCRSRSAKQQCISARVPSIDLLQERRDRLDLRRRHRLWTCADLAGEAASSAITQDHSNLPSRGDPRGIRIAEITTIVQVIWHVGPAQELIKMPERRWLARLPSYDRGTAPIARCMSGRLGDLRTRLVSVCNRRRIYGSVRWFISAHDSVTQTHVRTAEQK